MISGLKEGALLRALLGKEISEGTLIEQSLT
jgi:hypothetical protein